MEAEYVAGSHSGRELMFVQNQLGELMEEPFGSSVANALRQPIRNIGRRKPSNARQGKAHCMKVPLYPRPHREQGDYNELLSIKCESRRPPHQNPPAGRDFTV
jgi:hypothetical protein